MVEAFRERTLADLDRFAESRARFETAPESAADHRHWLMTVRYVELEAQAHLAWCDEVLESMREAED
jgi:hypothetical protein